LKKRSLPCLCIVAAWSALTIPPDNVSYRSTRRIGVELMRRS